MKWWAAVTVVAIPSQKALLMYPYVSGGKFSVLAQHCSRALLHTLQLTSDRCLIFASHLATGMIPPSYLAFYVSKEREGRSNTSPRTLCFRFAVTWSLLSTYHMQSDWIALVCPSSHTWFQEFFVINPSVLLQNLHYALIRFLISLPLILVAFITGNSSLEPLFEGLYAQIHVNLRWRVFGRNRTGDLTDY